MDRVLNQVFLGSEGFVARVGARAASSGNDVPKRQRQRQWRSLIAIEASAGDRNAGICEAHATGSFTLAEIVRHFGLHYATVSRIARS